MSWSDYTDYLIEQGLSRQTIRNYVHWLRVGDEWLRAEGTTLDDATATVIAQFVDLCVPNTAASRRQASVAFRHYWEMTDRARPPIRAIRVPQVPEMVCRAIEERQARDVVKVATGWWPEGTAVLAGLYLALRRFEIAKMEWSRFSEGLAWYTVTGKYSKTATLPVHPHLQEELAPYMAPGGWMFPGRFEGRHVNVATIWDWTIRVGREAGLEHLRPHELRHTSLATANDRTGNLRAVQTFARHSKPTTTSGYTRTTAARLREVSNALDYLG